MAIKQSSEPSVQGFDVTVSQVIGSVNFDDVGFDSPDEAAFSIIGKHWTGTDDVSSEYRYLAADGGSICVQVEHEKENK